MRCRMYKGARQACDRCSQKASVVVDDERYVCWAHYNEAVEEHQKGEARRVKS